MQKLVLVLVFISSVILSFGQSTLNFGINRRQADCDLPKSNAPYPEFKRVPKVEEVARIIPVNDNLFVVDGGWVLANSDSVQCEPFFDKNYNTEKWYNATVPGTVLTTLVAQGVYPDPYYGLNNMYIPESLARSRWWYRVRFDTPKVNDTQKVYLKFNGINYRANIWLNGIKVGQMAGAFRRGKFDVTGIIEPANNVLAVEICPPDNPGIGHEENKVDFGPNSGALCLDGATFIASEGWDWMPAIRDRNMGIWQSVELCYDNGVQFNDPYVITNLNLPDTSRATLRVCVPVSNTTDAVQKRVLYGNIEDKSFTADICLSPHTSDTIVREIVVQNPRLWWPNGYGKQNLYTMNLRLSDGTTTDVRFGIRELSYRLMIDTPANKGVRIEYSPSDVKQPGKVLFDYAKLRDADVPNKNTVIPSLTAGTSMDNFNVINNDSIPYLVILVNGCHVYCRGGNWGMDDAMKRCSRERLEPSFKLHKLAGFNMIRNWTGECTEEDFYALCDEYGMLVWNDFWMSTGNYNLLPLDWDLFLDNVTDVVRRFRNHPSIAIWCPRNEGYGEGLEKDIHSIVLKNDGSRHYHGNSRGLNLPGSGPWGYHDTPSAYFNRIAYGFNSELGSNSVPPYRTFKKFIDTSDQWPVGDVWYYHDYHVKGWSGWDAMERDMAKLSKKPVESALDYCNRSQVLNYNGHKVMIEAYNSKLWNDVSGVLYWCTQPAWPSLICQAYTWDYETFGTYFGLKKACEPTHIQWNIVNNDIELVNASLKEHHNATVTFDLYDVNGNIKKSSSCKTDIAKNSHSTIVNYKPQCNTANHLLRLTVKSSDGDVISRNDYWINGTYSNAPTEIFDIPTTKVVASYKKIKEGEYKVRLTNKGKVTAAYVQTRIADKADGETILPEYATDNYVNILPGQSIEIGIEFLAPVDDRKLIIATEGVNCNNIIEIK